MEYSCRKKKTQREEFLEIMDEIIPWNEWAKVIRPYYPAGRRGYTRSISGLYRFLRKSGQMAVKLPNPKYIPKPYEQMNYPGQRVQIDVKYVPKSCLVGAAAEKGGYYQYTFLDEYSRF